MTDRAVSFDHPWGETVIQELADVIVGGTPRTSVDRFWGGNIPWMISGDVYQKRITDVPGRISEIGLRNSNATLVEPPAVAIALAGQGKTRGTAAIALREICTNQSVALVKPTSRELDAWYLLFNLEFRYKELRSRSAGGGRAGLSKHILNELPIPTPPKHEQTKIAEILSTVDQAIGQTEAFITKQQRIKTGLMQDLLTRGIDEHGNLRSEETHEFKDSPLGRIPVEWDYSDIAKVLSEPPKNGYSPAEVDSWQGHYMLGLGCLTPNGFSPAQLKYAPKLDSSMRAYTLSTGDFLITRSNTRERVGMVGIYRDVGEPCIYPDLMVRLRFTDQVDADYMEKIFMSPSLRRQIENAATGTSGSMIKISAPIIKDLKFRRPPLHEQESALSILRAESKGIEETVAYLDKLRSLKAALMQDLLTGKKRITPLLEAEDTTAQTP